MSQNKKHNLNIHLWFPDLFETKGGIQTYSSYFLRVIQNLYSDIQCDLFIKNDKSFSSSSHLNLIKLHCTGDFPLPFRTPAFAAQILILAALNRPSLVISTHFNFIPLAYRLYLLFDIPYWAIAHGIEAWNLKNPNLKCALRYANRILAVSHYTRDRILKEQNLDPDKVVVLPNTFDSERFTITHKPYHLLKRYHLTQQQSVILTVARLSKSEQYKGYDRVLQALPKIRSVIPNVHYLLVGKGDDRPRIEQIIQELQLENHVTLAGFVPDEELCDHYNLCDVFAMPSKREGFGIVYLEAMACGKPCLGGNQDGALDALDQGEIGVLVNPDDIDEIADALIQILEKKYPNPLLYQPEQLRQAVIDRFGFEAFQQRLHQYLDDFMACS